MYVSHVDESMQGFYLQRADSTITEFMGQLDDYLNAAVSDFILPSNLVMYLMYMRYYMRIYSISIDLPSCSH